MREILNSQGYYICISLFTVGGGQSIYKMIEPGLMGSIQGLTI